MFDHVVGAESYRYINELVLYTSICTIFFTIGGLISSYRFSYNEVLTPNEYTSKLYKIFFHDSDLFRYDSAFI